MYDIHCHILPGFDDGPADWNEAVNLAQALVQDGVNIVVATPHGPGSNQSYSYHVQHLRSSVMRLREYIQRKRLSLQVILGTELVLVPELIQDLRAEKVVPYGDSRTILLEAPSDFLSEALEHAIYQLQLAHYRVILAHPERTQSVQRDPNSLIPFIERGVYVQVTAASLTGLHGSKLQAFTSSMLQHDMIHLIASDAHSAEGKRCPQLSEAVAYAATLIGQEKAQALVQTNPELLLNDQSLQVLEPQPIRKMQRPTSEPTRRRLWFMSKI